MDGVDGGLDLVRAWAAALDARAHDGLAFADQVAVPEASVLLGQAGQREADRRALGPHEAPDRLVRQRERHDDAVGPDAAEAVGELPEHALDAVLDAAIASGPRPTTIKRRLSIKDERSVKPTGSVYRHLDDGVAIAPGAYEVMFPGLGHDGPVLDEIVSAAWRAAATMG